MRVTEKGKVKNDPNNKNNSYQEHNQNTLLESDCHIDYHSIGIYIHGQPDFGSRDRFP